MSEELLARGRFNSSKYATPIFVAAVCAFVFMMYALAEWDIEIALIVVFSTIALFAWGILFVLMYKNSSLQVTSSKITGRTKFVTRVDLPMNQISAVGTSMFGGIAIGTSSGRIKFYALENQDEVYNVLLQLIESRKMGEAQANHVSGADELLKYKELLDQGLITLEEFNNRKNKILGE